jgi:hypothetical protein
MMEYAKSMRGKVPEWGDDYITEYVPASLIEKMHACESWVDEEGFHWGFGAVFATKLKETGENCVVLADKPWGQGWHDLKIIKTDGTMLTVRGCDVL